MEGWLQVPPERNVIGRAAWKIRYVRFGAYSPVTPTSARPVISPIRPTTANGVMGNATAAGNSGSTPSEWKPSAARSISNELHSGQLPSYLILYKQKNDTEPIARYPIASISSCYVGDVASRHRKKSVVLPTLVVNLRAETQLSSTKSFRRRSHDVPAREGAKKESTGKEILLFRPAPDNLVAIEKWAKEIQAHLVVPSSSGSNATHALESAFQEKFRDLDLETPTSSPSLFYINGEPSTALLSPSLRSRASNLSNIESDDKGSVMSSSASEIPSPGIDEDFPRSSGDGRPSLHVSTKLRQIVGARSPGVQDDIYVKTPVTLPARRETILDRFFSTAPPSPLMSGESTSMNSIARFEALIRDIEYGQSLETSGNSILTNLPKRIPSPTQRALEYVSSGLKKYSSETLEKRPITAYAGESPSLKEQSTRLSVGNVHRTLSRQASEASLGTTASMAGSTGGGVIVEANLGVSSTKRHSLADFSVMRLSATPPMFQLGASRRGSHSDIPRISESREDEPSPLASASGQSFSNHPRVVTRPLSREFSF